MKLDAKNANQFFVLFGFFSVFWTTEENQFIRVDDIVDGDRFGTRFSFFLERHSVSVYLFVNDLFLSIERFFPSINIQLFFKLNCI